MENPNSRKDIKETTGNIPMVSVIIPSRDEEKYIRKCLDSVVANDYPKSRLEILLVDGLSKDNTREIIKNYQNRYPFIKLLDNPKKFTPFAWNMGIKNAKGEIVILGGAHAFYSEDYISKCIRYLKEYKADNVGGIIKTVPKTNTLIARAIALCLSSFFGAGGSYFRTGSKKTRWVDTVFGGCYKKEVFEKIGLFNENLVRSQDMEFNLRLKRAGGKILLASTIVTDYYPKDNLKDFFLHNIEDGIWAVLPLKFAKVPLRLRHYIPLFFVLSLPLSIWLYVPVNLYFSAKTAFKEKDIKYFFVMPLVFATRHFGYGLGSVWGLIKLII